MSKTLQRSIKLVTNATAAEESAGKVILTVVTDIIDSSTDDFLFVHQVRRSGTEIPGFKGTYDITSGELTVENAGAVAITSGDTVTVMGSFYR